VAPILGAGGVSASLLPRPGASVSYSFTAGDASGAVTYDVSHQTHRGAGGFGPWEQRPSWTALSTRQVTVPVSSGTTACFRFRARDASGNASLWSAPSCSTSPVDDTSLSASRGVKRSKDRAAMRGAVSVMGAKGSSLVMRKQRARGVYVLARRGPREGSLKVYIGSSRIGTVDLKSSARGVVRVLVPSGTVRRGDVRLVSSSKRPVRVDAIWLRP
jgi:hypothetical protein